MDFLLTFLEGIVTFLSPCLLPMLPIYLAYFAGGAAQDASIRSRRTLVGALGFVLGFTLVFVCMGAFAGTLGSWLVAHQRALDLVCGCVMVLFGLSYLGVLRIPVLERTWRPASRVAPGGLLGSVAFGMVFAIGWTPCVGTFLASALGLAASSGSTARGVALLACYSLGLGLPFVLTAVLLDQLEGALSWAREHAHTIERVSGVVLVVVGALMATGRLGALLRLLS